MKILITGCLGVLGINFIKIIQNKKLSLVCIDKKKQTTYFKRLNLKKKINKFIPIDFNNKKKISNLLKKENFDVIFHFGAITQVLDALENPYENYNTNILGTINFLETIKNLKKKPLFVFSSSDKAYGNLKKNEMYKETFALKGDFPYDASKSCADIICQSYSKTFGLKIAILRSGNIFGPGDFNLDRLIPHVILRLLKNKEPLIRSNGKLIRDYIFVEDVANAYFKTMLKLKKSKNKLLIYNIGSKYNLSVIKVVAAINKIIGKSISPKILNKSKREIFYQKLNFSKIQKELKWKPFYSFEQGMKITIDWYKKNIDLFS